MEHNIADLTIFTSEVVFRLNKALSTDQHLRENSQEKKLAHISDWPENRTTWIQNYSNCSVWRLTYVTILHEY